MFDGVPMIYQGQEQHLTGATTPQNREALWLTGYNNETVLYKLIANLNAIRKHAYKLDNEYVTLPTHTVYQGSSELAFSKGVEGHQVVMVLSTQGTKSSPYDLNLPVTYNAGTAVTEVLNCKSYMVNGNGLLTVDMNKGEPRVFFPTQLMNGSGLCGYSSDNISYTTLVTGTNSTSRSLAVNEKGVANHVLPIVLLVAVLTGLGLI